MMKAEPSDSMSADKIIVVAGASGCGKSLFLQKLINSPDYKTKFGIQSNCLFVQANGKGMVGGHLNQCVLHYDIIRPFKHNLVSYRNDDGLRLLRRTVDATVITLVASQQTLVLRMEERSKRGGPGCWSEQLLKEYQNTGFLVDWYRAWFDELDSINTKTKNLYILSERGLQDLQCRDQIFEILLD